VSGRCTDFFSMPPASRHSVGCCLSYTIYCQGAGSTNYPLKLLGRAGLDRSAFGLVSFMGVSHAQPDGDRQRTDKLYTARGQGAPITICGRADNVVSSSPSGIVRHPVTIARPADSDFEYRQTNKQTNRRIVGPITK